MGRGQRGTKSPVFPEKWTEIVPKSTVSQAEQLVESIYALQADPQSHPAGPGPVRPSQANALPSQARVFPPRDQVFRALALTPPESVRVVLLGQDPYPTAGHANGLSFSVNPHVHPFPPSLRNIFKEYTGCFPYTIPTSGDLTPWAQQGVLLLNTVLTVREGASGSHRRLGWQVITDAVLHSCLRLPQTVVFLLWGRDAQAAFDRAAVGCGIDVKRISFTDACNTALRPVHALPFMTSDVTCQLQFLPVETAGEGKFLLPSSHPSPLGASKPCGGSPPFLGSYPFLRANALLGPLAVNWQLP